MIDFLISADIYVLNSLRSFVDPTSPLQVWVIHAGADIQVILVMIILVGLWLSGTYTKNDQPKRDALMIFYSIGFAFFVYLFLNLGLPIRPRPETVSAIRPLIDHLPDNSFPSGHGIFAGASTIAAFFYTRRWLAWILLITGIIMILSRVLAGIHYPGDIIVGYILGIIGSSVIYRLKDKKYITDYLLVYPIKIAQFLKL